MQYGHHTTMPSESRDDIQTLKSLTPYLWDYRSRTGAALAFVLFAKIANVGIPVLLKDIVDQLNTTTQTILVLPLSLLAGYGLLRLASTLFNELRDTVFASVRYGAMRKISTKVLQHLHKLSLRYHLERKTGGLSRDIQRGTSSVGSLLNYMVFSILPTLTEIVLIGGVFLFQYDIWFTIIALACVVAYIFFTFSITQWRMQYRTAMNIADTQSNSLAIDSLINYETVKYFNNEAYELKRYDASLQDWEKASVQSQTSLAALNIGQGFIISVGVTLIMLLASRGVVNKTMTIGDLVLVNTLLLQLFIPLNFLGVVYSQLKHALSDMDSMFKLLGETPEIQDAPDAVTLAVTTGCIRFEKVQFGYQANRQILFNVDFEIPAGKKVAVVGPSGSGKSTLARLLFRFYDVESGSIQIDGQDIRTVTQNSLRNAIGTVPQDTVLFNETIYHNIQYANPNASRGDVVRAAKLAHIDHFIQSLPDGYDSLVGERGLKLSGGEKQRIAIARAMLKNPRILIFDEATSSLDSQSEQVILSALQEVSQNHSTLVIAHRLSTIVDADQILVMDKGQIRERGNHAELLQQGGLYATLWEMQKKGSNEPPSADKPI